MANGKKLPQKPKVLFLVRHAHRDTSDRKRDNGLTLKGKRQAAALFKFLSSLEDIGTFDLVSSPKVRCVETLEPLAKVSGFDIHRSSLLLERQSRESSAAFKRRLLEFVDFWKASPSTYLVACSHGDLLPPLAELLTGGRLEFKKGAVAAVVLTKKGPLVRYLIRPADIY